MRIVLMLAALTACAHEAPPRPEAAPSAPAASNDIVTELQGDTVVRTYDLNHDKKPDDWKTFKLVPGADGGPTEILVKRELDTNFDGKPDVITFYNEDGTKSREQFDLDFDGKIDVTDTYEKGVLVRKDRAGMVAYYEAGKKVRVERDTRGAGKIDTWEYFENGKLQRIGEDLDGDGIVDKWTKASDEEAPQPAKKSAAK